MSNMFKKLAGVTAFEKSKFFQEGTYLAEIRKVKFNEGGHKGDSFVIETIIRGMKSEKADAPDVGEIAAHVWNASGSKREMGFANWKSFLCGAFDIGEDDLDDAGWEELSMNVLEEGALDGKLMLLQCWMTTTQSGNPFTNHKWVREATAADKAEFGIE